MQVAIRSATVRSGRFAVVLSILWRICIHKLLVTRMAVGFARYSVSNGVHIHELKKTASRAVSKDESKVVAPGELAGLEECRVKRRATKIFSLP